MKWVPMFLAILLGTCIASAQSEDERRAGFYEHKKDEHERELEREKGLKAYLREQAEWEDQRKDDIKADKKRKKAESPVEGGPEYRADRLEKLADWQDAEKEKAAYLKYKKSFDAKNAKEQAKRDAWALEEYGLDKERPRFDWAKRGFSPGTKVGSSGGSSGGGGNSSSGAPSFPPAPDFNDFGEGYIPPPPPAPSDNFGFDQPPESFPPPPVPFPPPNNGDFDGGFYPPPPPPPMDGDGFGF